MAHEDSESCVYYEADPAAPHVPVRSVAKGETIDELKALAAYIVEALEETHDVPDPLKVWLGMKPPPAALARPTYQPEFDL